MTPPSSRQHLSRRDILAAGSAAVAVGLTGFSSTAKAAETATSEPADGAPRICLNTGTMRRYQLPLEKLAEIAAAAGYAGIEPWLDEVRRVEDPAAFRARLKDLNLRVESAIGFPSWAVDDDERRAAALEQFRSDMEAVRSIGGEWIAAPPAGINRTSGVDLRKIGERYREVLKLGRETGVRPQLEIWGSAMTLGTVSEAIFVAIEAGDRDAALLLDAYHMYKGGSSPESLRLLSGAAMHCFHINDYPADPPRETINDGDRVFPGDGIGPIVEMVRTLHQTGFRGALSLELFNREYQEKYTPEELARIGFEKTKAVVEKALA